MGIDFIRAEAKNLSSQMEQCVLNVKGPALRRAWVGFLQFAICDPHLRIAFEEATGISLPPSNDMATTPRTKAVDEVLLDFERWVTVHYWGSEGVPVQFLAAATARFATPPCENS